MVCRLLDMSAGVMLLVLDSCSVSFPRICISGTKRIKRGYASCVPLLPFSAYKSGNGTNVRRIAFAAVNNARRYYVSNVSKGSIRWYVPVVSMKTPSGYTGR
jgi:hypothetical protein